MRTTIRIDDDLLLALKEQARREKSPLNRLLNRTLRRGLEATRGDGTRSARHREKVHAMGEPGLGAAVAFDLIERRKTAVLR